MDAIQKFLQHFFDMESDDYRRIAKIIARAITRKRDTKERLRQSVEGL